MSDDMTKRLLEQMRQLQGGRDTSAAPASASMIQQLTRMLGGRAPPGGDEVPPPSEGGEGEPEDPNAEPRLENPLWDPSADILSGSEAKARGEPSKHPKIVYDIRHGALPEGFSVVGPYTLDKLPDGSTALNLDSVSYVRVNTDLFKATDAKKVSTYTLTMDVMVSKLPLTGVPLYQTSFPEPRATSEAVLSSDGRVGGPGKPGERNLFKEGKWNRIVVCVNRSSTMTTYVNGTECSSNGELQAFSTGGRDRFSLNPSGFHLFVPESGRPIEGGLLVRYISVEAVARSSAEVKRSTNVDTIFNQYEKEIRAAGKARQAQLSLSPIYKDQTHPTWMDPAFLSEFLDSMIEGSGLEGASSYFALNVFFFALQGMMTDQVSWLSDQVKPPHLIALQSIVNGLEPSIMMYRRFQLALKGPGQFVAFITFLTGALESMQNSNYLFIPGGYRNRQEAQEMVYHVQRVSDDHWRFSVICLGGNGLSYHPSNAQDPPKIKYKTVVVVDQISKKTILDATWWAILLAHFCIPNDQNTAKNLYGTVFPWLTKSTWESTAASATLNPVIPWRTIPRTNSSSYRQFIDGFNYMMMAQGFSSTECKCVLLNLRRQFMKMVVNDLNCVQGLTTSDIKILHMASQQLAHCAMKFHKRVAAPNQYLMSLLSDAKAMDEKVKTIPHRDATSIAPPAMDLNPDMDKMTQFNMHPLMERLLRKDVDGLAGPKVPIPEFIPIDFTLIPLKVTNFEEALTALRFTDKLCTLISVQSHIVKNPYFLKVALIEYVFTQLIPVPAGPKAGRACFWMDTPMRYGVQLDVVILVNRILEHFVSSAFSLQTTRSFDAVRIVTSGAIVAIADCVLRKVATDHPSEFCLALIGTPGKNDGFGVGMGFFAEQSETIEATSPELNITRTGIMDYFFRLNLPQANQIYNWESGMKIQQFLETGAPMLASLCKGLAFPIDAQRFLSYLVDSHDL
eukprot:PhF_6_TR7895/c0_g1_i2/m.11637